MAPVSSKLARPPIRQPRDSAPRTSYTPSQLAKRYGFVAPPAAQTQWVAFISLGGGTSLQDIQRACQREGCPTPPVEFISVDGTPNQYTGDANGADGENALDSQIIATGGRGMLGILVYMVANSDTGPGQALQRVAADNRACVVFMSWGAPEEQWGQAGRAAWQQGEAACKAKDIPVLASSGDAGSGDGEQGNNTDFPACSPGTISMGGTTILPTGEVGWSSGGGGSSRIYPRPPFQNGVPAALGQGRCEPDLAVDADPNSGYPVVIGPAWFTFGGTSAAGPLMATGIALLVSSTGKRVKVDQLMAAIYSGVLTDITKGSNGAFTSTASYDLVTGNGTPNAAFWASLSSNASPPAPPPVSPPPPPPLPPPVTSGPTLAQVVNVVNGVFGMAEQQLPRYLDSEILEPIRKAIIIALTNLWHSR